MYVICLSLFIIMLMNIINKASWCQSVSSWSTSWTWLILHMNKNVSITSLFYNGTIFYYITKSQFKFILHFHTHFSWSPLQETTSCDVTKGIRTSTMSLQLLVQQRLLSDNPTGRKGKEHASQGKFIVPCFLARRVTKDETKSRKEPMVSGLKHNKGSLSYLSLLRNKTTKLRKTV